MAASSDASSPSYLEPIRSNPFEESKYVESPMIKVKLVYYHTKDTSYLINLAINPETTHQDLFVHAFKMIKRTYQIEPFRVDFGALARDVKLLFYNNVVIQSNDPIFHLLGMRENSTFVVRYSNEHGSLCSIGLRFIGADTSKTLLCFDNQSIYDVKMAYITTVDLRNSTNQRVSDPNEIKFVYRGRTLGNEEIVNTLELRRSSAWIFVLFNHYDPKEIK